MLYRDVVNYPIQLLVVPDLFFFLTFNAILLFVRWKGKKKRVLLAQQRKKLKARLPMHLVKASGGSRLSVSSFFHC